MYSYFVVINRVAEMIRHYHYLFTLSKIENYVIGWCHPKKKEKIMQITLIAGRIGRPFKCDVTMSLGRSPWKVFRAFCYLLDNCVFNCFWGVFKEFWAFAFFRSPFWVRREPRALFVFSRRLKRIMNLLGRYSLRNWTEVH